MEFNSGTPPMSALYLVDRGMQGKYYRYYNADTDKWGMCGIDMNEALANKDNHSTFETIGFFPWVGPLTGPKFDPNKQITPVEPDAPVKPVAKAKVAKKKVSKKSITKAAKKFPAVPGLESAAKSAAKAKVVTNKNSVFADGTIFFRADREKWVAMWNGKQEAARDSIEACQKFLLKKYGFSNSVVIEVK